MGFGPEGRWAAKDEYRSRVFPGFKSQWQGLLGVEQPEEYGIAQE
jgi:hypothetical protein